MVTKPLSTFHPRSVVRILWYVIRINAADLFARTIGTKSRTLSVVLNYINLYITDNTLWHKAKLAIKAIKRNPSWKHLVMSSVFEQQLGQDCLLSPSLTHNDRISKHVLPRFIDALRVLKIQGMPSHSTSNTSLILWSRRG